jgi:sensor c-di-GMP phosphodiesterase-like protein
MGIAVIAQGVETEEQRRLLRQTDPAAQAQGFHFSKAVSVEQAGGLLREGFLGERKSSTA